MGRSGLSSWRSSNLAALAAGAVVSLALLAAGGTLVAQENPAAVNALWVAESAGVLELATADGSLLVEIPGLTNVRAAAVDHHRPTLWLYAGQNVYAYGYDGTQKLVVPLALPNPANAALAVNEHDGSIWLGADQDLVSVSASGQVLRSLRLADDVEALAVDAAGALLWVGTASSAAAYDAISGAPVSALDLGASPDLRDLDLDPGGEVWVALGGSVRGYAGDGSRLLAATVEAPLHVAGDGHGGAWVATAKDVLQLSAAGQVTASLSPFGGQGKIVEVVLDPSNGGAWVANERAVAQVDAGGRLVRAFQFQPPVHIWDLALYADVIPPQLIITAPAEGSYLDSRTPTIAVTYSDIGSGVNPATLAFTANASPLQVSCSTSPAGASCVVATPFPEGPQAVSATVKDYAGNTSQAANVTFTIDTIPPVPVAPQAVTVTVPAGGSSTVSAGAGSAEAAATVLLTDVTTGATAETSIAADGSFSVTIACQAGDSIQIVLRDAAGNLSAPATVTVPGPTGNGLPPDPSTVASRIDPTVVTDLAASTAFLYTGAHPIQQGVQPGAVDPFTVAVLRGSVHDRSGQPIPGVAVKVLGRSDLGGTSTRADGMFDLAANGGGLITVQFDKSGFLTAQRQVQARWRDYAWLPDVVLVPIDGTSTVIDTTLAALQVARGSAVQDRDGSRQATLLFPAGTTAQLVLAGGQTLPLSTLTVRATEYTVAPSGPLAMPAQLPPASAYTYAVELGADEAAAAGSTVKFSQPVPFYLENFLGFPVGGVVPAGYYDRGKAAWVASDNGLVVKILSITAGLADLDLTGAGAPADTAALAALGITVDERQSLAALYAVGQTLWRVPVRHFSAWDFNWPFEVPPEDLAPPNPDVGPPPDLADPCDQPGASSISCENQTLGEDAPIAGTPFTLHYQGDRVPGRLGPRSVQIGLSGANLPAALVRIDLDVTIAGRRFQQSFAPGANLSSTFTWDGLDAYGRQLQGDYPATATVSYVVDGQYAPPPAGVPLVFAQAPSGVAVGLAPLRFEASFSRTFTRQIGFVDATAEKLGGWTLSVHHEYDPATRTVWRGDGSRENGDPIATQAVDLFGGVSVFTPRSGWLDADGSFDVVYTGIGGYSEIDHVDRGGNLQLMYTGGIENVFVYGAARDRFNQLFFVTCDELRTQTQVRTVLFAGSSTSRVVLSTPGCIPAFDFLPDNAGGFYLVYGSVFHLGPDGSSTTVVDSAAAPTLSATSAALAPDGSLFIADAYGGRIFRLDPLGRLGAVAGTGTPGFSGDGGSAIAAQLRGPSGVTLALDGTLWVTDAGRLRRIDPSGFIATVGGGGFNPPAVGGSPFDVGIPGRVRLDPNGVVYFFLDPGIWRFGDAFPGFATSDFVVASEDGSEAYRFSAGGRHLGTVDPVTGAVLYSFLYDGSNLVSGIQDRDGRLTRIERDGQGNAVAIVSPDGQRTALTVGSDGYLQSATNPAGEAVTFTYAPGGLMATQTGPRGFQSTYQYSSDGRLVLDTDAAGGFRSFGRTAGPGFEAVTMTTGAGDSSQFAVQYPAAGGRLRLFTGPDGSAVQSAIAPNGQQSETWPDGSVVTTTLSADPRFGLQSPIVASEQMQLPSGLTLTTISNRSVVLSVAGDPLSLSSQTDTWTVNGQTSTRLFDRVLMRWTFQTPTGRQTTAAVDSSGRPTLLQVGTFAPLQLSYDGSGRLLSATRRSGTGQRSMSFTYGADGRLQTIIDPLQRTFSFAWDAAGRLRSRTLPDGRIVGFSYDADGNLTSVTPPGRPFHAFTFTPVNLEQSYTAPDLGSGRSSTTYGYDLDRRLTTITRPDGSTIVLAYQQGRLSSLNYPEGAINLAYDSGTALLRTVSGPGGEVLAYTSDGPLPIRTSWSGPVSGSIERSFNQDLRLSSQTVNGQMGVAFQYDYDGLLTQAGNLSVSRDPSSGLVTGTSLGAVTTSQIQDDLGELSSASAAYAGSEILRTDFTRDAAGRVAHKVETILGSTNIYDYTYDTAGRLTDVALNGGPLSHYDYDTNGNRVTTTEGSVITTAAYDSQDRLLQWGDVTYAYSASGDLASKTQNGSTVAYTYDALGNLLTVVDAIGIETEYVMDGQNRRVGKKVNGVPVQGFLWQDGLEIAVELDGAGNIVSRFIFATRVNVPDYMVNNGAVYRILTDDLGSPRLVVNSSTGEVAQRMDYDTWGAVVQDTNPGFQPFGFRGGLYDTRTGLVRFGARDYEPGTGRWTAKDPILFAGGSTDLYAYAADDPVNLTDPESLIPPPASNWPLPPGWDSTWSWRYPEGNSPATPRWFDPEGGEWRWHAPDKWHEDGHWDHNPWDRWNSPWRNVPHNPCPVPAPSPEPVPWWRLLDDAIPDPLPITLNPCFFMPSLCLGTGTGAVET